MYRPKDRTTQPLFPELFPFGGKLDERNRWFRIAEFIPWQDLEDGIAESIGTRVMLSRINR